MARLYGPTLRAPYRAGTSKAVESMRRVVPIRWVVLTGVAVASRARRPFDAAKSGVSGSFLIAGIAYARGCTTGA